MSFSAEYILETFKETKVAGAPQLKHSQYLNYLAKRLGYQDYNHFKGCVKTAPSDRIGDFYLGLMQRLCALRLPKEDVDHVRLNDCTWTSVGFDSYFIGWDKRGREVRVPTPGHGRLSAMDFREIFDEPLYVIETEAEFHAWQLKWGSFALVPVAMAKSRFPSLFNQQSRVVEDPPIAKIKSRVQRELKDKGLI